MRAFEKRGQGDNMAKLNMPTFNEQEKEKLIEQYQKAKREMRDGPDSVSQIGIQRRNWTTLLTNDWKDGCTFQEPVDKADKAKAEQSNRKVTTLQVKEWTQTSFIIDVCIG